VTNWLGQTASYTYDQAGRLIGLQSFNSILTTYGYDNADRLIDLENRRSDTGAIATYQFSLDANGNRVQIDETAPITWTVSSGTKDYTYNDMKNRLLTAGSLSFAYDFEGQLASLNTGSTYAFDYEHRLKSISGTDSIQYAYDGSGNRLEAVRDGAITRYIYDAAGNLMAEADGLNNITRYYIHGLGLLAMVNLADEVYCYHFDAVGSTIAMTDETQAMVNTYAYTPFGSIGNEQETLPQSFKYVGQHGVMAEPNGFYYMRARYYDPQVGRFISEDPIGFAGGDVNLYVYCINNPILFIDPLGLELRIYNRKAKGTVGSLGGNHAFLYSTETGQSLGMGGSSGSQGNVDEKIKGVAYNIVENPNGISETEIMDYMKGIKNKGMWIPSINDCHSKVADTLEHFGLENPGATGGRWGSIPSGKP
jgi:RHS repeat-associated protein